MIEEKIKRTFVADILKQQGNEIVREMQKRITRYTDAHTQQLISTPQHRLTAQEYAEGELSLTVVAHQRFLDMGAVGKQARNKRKRRPLYNSIVFGNYYRIAYKLMYYFTEEVIEEIKKSFETEKK